MSGKRKGPPRGGPSKAVLQIGPVRRTFPSFRPRIGRDQSVVWEGELQPSPESPVYAIRIVHSVDRSPQVFVLSPALAPGAPHIYRGGALCLYWPKEWSWWHSRESLVETIIPWTAMWLYYYEVWLVTGEWLGPSSHDPAPDSNDDDEKSR